MKRRSNLTHSRTIKSFLMVTFAILGFTVIGSAQGAYNDLFTHSTMRVDYFHTGTKGTETVSLDQVYEEGEWPGSKVNLIDDLNLGEYAYQVSDTAGKSVYFSRGYSSVFNEWQSTDEALAGTYRTFHETARLPFPKSIVKFSLMRRDKNMVLHEVFSTIIDPKASVQVDRSRRAQPFRVEELMKSG